MNESVSRDLRSNHFIVSCEGAAEEVIVRKLLAANAFVFPSQNVIEVTRKRKASVIQDAFLGFDYDWPVSILRVHDSRKESFALGKLYKDRYSVIDVVTHPEIDVLTIINEGKWEAWKRTSVKPSEYCATALRMPKIKQKGFLEQYWDVEGIVGAAREYRRLSKLQPGEICLADIIS